MGSVTHILGNCILEICVFFCFHDNQIFIFVARFFNVVPMSLLSNIRRKVKISWKMQIMLWFAGLRGAIAFSLAQTVQSSNRPVIITTTLFIILFTTLVLGISQFFENDNFLGPITAPLLKKLKLQQELIEEDIEHSESLLLTTVDLSRSDSSEKLELPGAPRNMTAVHRYWRIFDEKVMKPLVGGKPRRNYDVQ
jgi:sodium/hydrogen exchanger 8